MKKCYVKITTPCLEGALRIPENVCIEDIFQNSDDKLTGEFTMILSGGGLSDKCSTAEGGKIKQASMHLKQGVYHYCEKIEVYN